MESTSTDIGDTSRLLSVVRNCPAVLLDLNGTFAFDCDRLGPTEDFHLTYRDLGGQKLKGDMVRRAVLDTCLHLHNVGRDPSMFASFPTVRGALADVERCRG